jgi:hypothetical protein
MHVVGSVPWSIRSDTPKELLFLGYIGRQEGFQAPETAPPASSIEAEWQAWWQFLLAHNFDTLGEAVRRDTPGITGIPFLRELGRRHQAVYDPPRFSVLADRPALQTLCHHWWPEYHREWETVGGSGLAFFEQVSQCLQHLRPNQLVRECVRSTGKRRVPFTLSFDFLSWPEDYEHRLSPTHFVLGRRYLADDTALRHLMRAAITTALEEGEQRS